MSEPITPDEAAESLTERELTEYDWRVEDINKMLKEGGRTYSCDLLTPAITPKIIMAFTHAGWRVRVVDDFRDGDYLEFSRAH